MNKYRENTTWDSVHWGTHCVDCYPGGCPMRVYVKDGVIVREEPSGTLPLIDPAVPDFNPMGCMQGTSWSQSLHGPDRPNFPSSGPGSAAKASGTASPGTRRSGRSSDILVDAIEDHGPRSIIREGTPERSSAARPAASLASSAARRWTSTPSSATSTAASTPRSARATSKVRPMTGSTPSSSSSGTATRSTPGFPSTTSSARHGTTERKSSTSRPM